MHRPSGNQRSVIQPEGEMMPMPIQARLKAGKGRGFYNLVGETVPGINYPLSEGELPDVKPTPAFC